MAPEGHKRQNRWNRRGWIRLCFEAMRRHKHEREKPNPHGSGPSAAGTPAMCITKWFTWIVQKNKDEQSRIQRQKQAKMRLQEAIKKVIEQNRVEAMIHRRKQQRGENICARTRGAACAHRRDYSETRRNKQRIGTQEEYRLIPFALTDKIGRTAWIELETISSA